MSGKPEQSTVEGQPAVEDTWEAGRASALYDPDTVYRGPEAAQRNGLNSAGAETNRINSDDAGAPSIYAKGERRRGAGRMTAGMVKRISDEIETVARSSGKKSESD